MYVCSWKWACMRLSSGAVRLVRVWAGMVTSTGFGPLAVTLHRAALRTIYRWPLEADAMGEYEPDLPLVCYSRRQLTYPPSTSTLAKPVEDYPTVRQ
jgi:hypothetical protein